MSHDHTQRRVPPWLDWLTAMRERQLMPAARYALILLDVDFHRRDALTIPADYRPQHYDNYGALRGLDIELVFSEATGFHRLRIICDNCLTAPVRRLLLLPMYCPKFILLRKGGQP